MHRKHCRIESQWKDKNIDICRRKIKRNWEQYEIEIIENNNNNNNNNNKGWSYLYVCKTVLCFKIMIRKWRVMISPRWVCAESASSCKGNGWTVKQLIANTIKHIHSKTNNFSVKWCQIFIKKKFTSSLSLQLLIDLVKLQICLCIFVLFPLTAYSSLFIFSSYVSCFLYFIISSIVSFFFPAVLFSILSIFQHISFSILCASL